MCGGSHVNSRVVRLLCPMLMNSSTQKVLELGEFFSYVCKSVGNAESLNINKSCGELGECFWEGGNFGITCLDASRLLGVFFIMFCSHSVKA